MLSRLLKGLWTPKKADTGLWEALRIASELSPAEAERRLTAAAQGDSAPDLRYWLGVVRLVQNRGPEALADLNDVLHAHHDHFPCRALLGDALLATGDTTRAKTAYQEVFGAKRKAFSSMSDLTTPAHPQWLNAVRQLREPWPPPSPHPGEPFTRFTARSAGRHLANFAAVLAVENDLKGAEECCLAAVSTDATDPFPHFVLAVIYTLCGRSTSALAHAEACKRFRNPDEFGDLPDLCCLSAALDIGQPAGSHDMYAVWKNHDFDAPPPACVLPEVDGQWLTPSSPGNCYFIACDPAYYSEHARALLHSIRTNDPSASVHLHLFSYCPRDSTIIDCASEFPGTHVQITHEGDPSSLGLSIREYAPHARFVRFWQWMEVNRRPCTMLDADSLLIDASYARSLAETEIGLVFAGTEPIWHRMLGGFLFLDGGEASIRFARAVADDLQSTLAAGTSRFYLDQTVLYVNAHRLEAAGLGKIDRLNYRFCDTVFHDGSFVWSITADKDRESRFTRLKNELLQGRSPPHRTITQ